MDLNRKNQGRYPPMDAAGKRADEDFEAKRCTPFEAIRLSRFLVELVIRLRMVSRGVHGATEDFLAVDQSHDARVKPCFTKTPRTNQ